MTDYGVLPTGFLRKTASEIKIDHDAAMRLIFGSAIILDAESPAGQLVGFKTLTDTLLWEVAETIYSSLDPDQAEGKRLDQLGRMRLIERGDNESDAEYRRRITNEDRPDINLRAILAAVRNVEGVVWCRVVVNDSDKTDANGIPAHSLCIIVVGGDDEEVADAIFDSTVAGIGLWGNTYIEIDDGGFCRNIGFMRPTLVPVDLTISMLQRPVSCGCAPPTLQMVVDQLESELGFTNDCGLHNGEDISVTRITGAVSKLLGADIMGMTGTRIPNGVQGPLPILIAFDELATMGHIAVVYV
jgi:hypothetical protein